MQALLLLLAQIASKDAFHVLRTERQLGYVVQCGVRSIGRSAGLSVHIQSAVMGPRDLEREIESWWRSFEARVVAPLDEAALRTYQDAIAANLDEPPKTMLQEASPVWGEIVDRTFRWDYDGQLAAAVRGASLGELKQFFERHVAPAAPLRRKAVSLAFSHKEAKKAGLALPELAGAD